VADVLDLAAHLEAARPRAAEVLRVGELVVAPTDTVYAVLADAFAPDATQRLFAARRADRGSPLTVLIRSPRQVVGLTDRMSEGAERLMAAFWPGPLTLVCAAARSLGWDLGDTKGTVALRMPADELIHELITEVGPLASSGACRAGMPPATTVDGAVAALADDVALYLDGGSRPGGTSTVVDVSRGGAEVLRVGAISANAVVEAATGAVGWGGPSSDRTHRAQEP
jgi:L-threonylcarbamoyladenylate synthase